MVSTLLFLLPTETWLLLLVAAGFMMIFGFRKAATGIITSVLLLAVLSPFIDALVDALPTWLLVIMMGFFAASIVRLILGERVADHLIALILHDIILMPFRFIAWVFRGPGRRV